MDDTKLQNIIHAIIQAADKSVSINDLEQALRDELDVDRERIKAMLSELEREDDSIQELRRVAGGYRFYIKQEYVAWIKKQRDGRGESLPRVLRETLAIIAYKQPISHGEINLIRGRATHQYVIDELLDRSWIKVVACGEENSRAALYRTTIEFLEYFDLNNIYELPELPEVEPELKSFEAGQSEKETRCFAEKVIDGK